MARTASKLRVVAMTALQDTLRKRVPYVVVFLVVLIGVGMSSEMVFLRMASEAGETGISTSIRSGFVANLLELWNVATMALAVLLGAGGLSSEITAKTIVNVLSRPVDRATYLFGRWLGVLVFLWGFAIVGVLLALATAHYFDVQFVQTLWLGIAEMFVEALLVSGLSLGLSVLMHPLLAGACAILLQMLPALLPSAMRNPQWMIRWPAMAAYYMAPALMPGDLIQESFSKEMLQPDYTLLYKVLAENLVYGFVFFILACAVFSRRELRLR